MTSKKQLLEEIEWLKAEIKQLKHERFNLYRQVARRHEQLDRLTVTTGKRSNPYREETE